MAEALGAEKGERTADRLGYRSGYYGRMLITRIGKLELRVPQDRAGRFSTEVFERYQRSERALAAALAEMYVQGVSTRKVKAITEELCGHIFSASSFSAINQRLDEPLAQFAGRPLAEAFPYLILDARYERVREAGVISSQAVLIPIGVDWDGRRQRGERRENGIIVAATKPTGCPMPQPNELSRSLAALDENSTLIAVIEMSQSSWLVAVIIPGIERQPAKKLSPDEGGLLRATPSSGENFGCADRCRVQFIAAWQWGCHTGDGGKGGLGDVGAIPARWTVAPATCEKNIRLLHRWRGEAEKAGPLAESAGHRSLCDPPEQHCRFARTPASAGAGVPGEDRSARHGAAETSLSRLAARRAGTLRHGGDPRLEEEDAKRPSRERESLVGERMRLGNRVKITLARLGIRGFKPTLRTAGEQLERLRTPEGEPVVSSDTRNWTPMLPHPAMLRPVKRKRALLGSNPLRNSRVGDSLRWTGNRSQSAGSRNSAEAQAPARKSSE